MTAEDPPTDTLPRSSTQTSEAPKTLRTVVMRGPDAPRSVVLGAGTSIIGTHGDCAVMLTDPTVSRRHASVELLRRGVRVRDLGSKNGVVYLGARVEVAEVPAGGTVELGSTQLGFFTGPDGETRMSERQELEGLVGHSVSMRQLFGRMELVAPLETAILIRGETGSGKERVARALHALSPRRAGPLFVLDCPSIQPELAQSALFGHVKGAFTGAQQDAVGALEAAHGGTLFLDELGELPQGMQRLLLRALETRTVTPLGETRARPADFRLLCATHRDLEQEAAHGRFRTDLLHRVAAVTLEVPPLRQRRDDIEPLIQDILSEVGATVPLPRETVALLRAHLWPGNVRELRNTVLRIVALGAEAPLPLGPGAADLGSFSAARAQALQAFERSFLESLLKAHGGVVAQAHEASGLARSYFYKLLRDHSLLPKKGGTR